MVIANSKVKSLNYIFIPTFFNTNNITKYPITIIVNEIPNDNQKSIFFFNNTGNIIKSSNDGITSQKIPCDNSAIFTVSFVSIYIHTKASNETNGMDASILPIVVLRFEISDIATIVTDESNTLIM